MRSYIFVIYRLFFLKFTVDFAEKVGGCFSFLSKNKPDGKFIPCLYRKSVYLGVLYMVPTSMHSNFIVVTYVVPNEVGKRISFGKSLFLSFMVFLLQLNGDLAELSTAIPVVGL